MKKLLHYWFVPLIIAIFIVFTIKWLFFIELEVSDNSMAQTFKKGDKILCLRSKPKQKNNIIICFNASPNQKYTIKRIVALPGDTFKIAKSLIYLNGSRMSDEAGVCYSYNSFSDSITSVCKYLNNNDLTTEYQNAFAGIFFNNLTVDDLKILQSKGGIINIKRRVVEPHISPMENNFGKSLYWNRDNLGPLIIPKKRMQIIISHKSVAIYGPVIQKESGEKLVLKDSDYYLGLEKISTFTFKYNYYFLLNDNRSKGDDSRSFGFISENEIVGRYFCRLPW